MKFKRKSASDSDQGKITSDHLQKNAAIKIAARLLSKSGIQYWVFECGVGSVFLVVRDYDLRATYAALRECKDLYMGSMWQRIKLNLLFFKKLKISSRLKESGSFQLLSLASSKGKHTNKLRLSKDTPIGRYVESEFLEGFPDGIETPISRRNLLQHINFPIDVVYTWVDSSDKKWAAKLAKFKPAKIGNETRDSVSDARWRSWDELFYSMKSIEKYAPWVRKVFVVTDQQKPDWWITRKDVVIVHHRDFFAKYISLPTFNSHVIESQLHRIPGLSEHFIYFNDDVFLARSLKPSSFFLPTGISKFFPSSAMLPLGDVVADDIAPDAAGKNLRKMLGDSIVTPVNKMKHTPHPLRKSILGELEMRFSKQYHELGQNKFRSSNDFSPVTQLYPYWAFLRGLAVPSTCKLYYFDMATKSAIKLSFRLLRMGRFDFFCLNMSQGTGNATWFRIKTNVIRFLLACKFSTK
jgi:hypothetical protein